MNERIKLLAEQAGLTWRVQPLHYTNTNNPIDFPVSANRDLEKFAELIVRECMNICYRTDTEYEGHKVKSTVIASKVAEHFGVEE